MRKPHSDLIPTMLMRLRSKLATKGISPTRVFITDTISPLVLRVKHTQHRNHPSSTKPHLVKYVHKTDTKQKQQSLGNVIELEGETQDLTLEKDLRDSFLALPDPEQLEIIKRLETLKCDLIKSKKCQTETLQPTQDPRDLLYTKAPTSPESQLLRPSPKGQKDMDEAPQTLHQVQRVEVTHEIELDSHLSGALSYNLFSEKVGTTWAQELAEYNTQTMIKSFSKEPNLSDLSPEKMESRQSRIQGKNGSIFMDHQGTLNQITSD
uniref:Uncharacterized protein n=1 Tax=Sphaerodactylus townsendi TaxID=933632 RepID=A0ACB8EQ17_9SAUR